MTLAIRRACGFGLMKLNGEIGLLYVAPGASR